MGQVSPSEAQELVSQAAAGSAEAQSLLVQRLRSRVHSISLSILGNGTDAEDTTQVSLIEILKSASQFRGESFYGWADKIAVRTAIRHARERRIRAMQYEGRPDLEDLDAPLEAPCFESELPRTLVEYLAELPEARRVVLVLRHVMEYSVDEIAELTQVSKNTVKDRLLHARAQLRKIIRRDFNGIPSGRSSC